MAGVAAAASRSVPRSLPYVAIASGPIFDLRHLPVLQLNGVESRGSRRTTWTCGRTRKMSLVACVSRCNDDRSPWLTFGGLPRAPTRLLSSPAEPRSSPSRARVRFRPRQRADAPDRPPCGRRQFELLAARRSNCSVSRSPRAPSACPSAARTSSPLASWLHAITATDETIFVSVGRNLRSASRTRSCCPWCEPSARFFFVRLTIFAELRGRRSRRAQCPGASTHALRGCRPGEAGHHMQIYWPTVEHDPILVLGTKAVSRTIKHAARGLSHPFPRLERLVEVVGIERRRRWARRTPKFDRCASAQELHGRGPIALAAIVRHDHRGPTIERNASSVAPSRISTSSRHPHLQPGAGAARPDRPRSARPGTSHGSRAAPTGPALPRATRSATVGPPNPAALMMMIAPTIGEPNSEEIAAKLAAAAISATTWSGASFLAERTANTARPVPIPISGASGPSTNPSPTDASAASTTPGSSIGCVGPPPAVTPFRGLMAPGTRQTDDREGNDHTRHREHGQWPPHRNLGESEIARELLVHPLLGVMNQLKEPPRSHRHDHADDRREYQQHAVILAPKQRPGSTGGATASITARTGLEDLRPAGRHLGPCLCHAGGPWSRANQGADDPQERQEEPDPEQPVVALAERRQPKVDPARHIENRQHNPQESHPATAFAIRTTATAPDRSQLYVRLVRPTLSPATATRNGQNLRFDSVIPRTGRGDLGHECPRPGAAGASRSRQRTSGEGAAPARQLPLRSSRVGR